MVDLVRLGATAKSAWPSAVVELVVRADVVEIGLLGQRSNWAAVT